MNILDLQDKLKNLSEQQLVQAMQMPDGQMPQFLVLGELTRRKKMRDAFAQEQNKDRTTTVAQEAVAAAGMPPAFAGQMAGTMAPQTNMATNSGAAPQQSAMPAPTQKMAGGGIVALQDGGKVDRYAPGGIVVKDGIPYRVDPETGRVTDTAGNPVPPALARQIMEGGAPPSLADAATGPVDMPPPSLADVATGPVDMPAPDAVAPAVEGRSIIPPRGARISGEAFPGSGIGVYATPTSDLLSNPLAAIRSRREEAASMPQAPVAGIDFSPFETIMSRPLREGPGSGPAGMPRDAIPATLAAPPQGEGPRSGPAGMPLDALPRNLSVAGIDFSPFETVMSRPRREGPGSGPAGMPRDAIPAEPEFDFTQLMGVNPAMLPTGPQREEPEPEPEPDSDSDVPDEPIVEPDVETRTTPLAGAAAAGAPSDYEQELLNMLQAREKRAEQDKWLALAQAGMALMSSNQPTFGGALGEAGQAGLGALREGQSTSEADRLALLGQLEQSRLSREELAIRRQAAAARGGTPRIPAALITPLIDRLEAAQEALGQLPPPPEPGWFGQRSDPYQVRRTELGREVENLKRQVNTLYLSQLGITPFGGDAVPDFSDSPTG